ncbi:MULTISPECIES: PCC domain-containing protein [Chryseobacterium]|uniref:DNA-binding protein with PD1-like motif n=1 Tax=Chryseobacterium camelliae TaxID=1265445 RepID=A0ABU0TGR6_9FLAO|nr:MULTISPECIES: DUF296 domain-containing protein [Chryseobacterium]MDT3405949.1 putative DNA-binding protein with PD1-like motif [Pseudacidovorax intermedius]MDQ1096247.1 putative DNA-binding protein with PD1-like motif [Chryseobacterium camelliae]MDQ1100184.1 putative DNA-binding protein with PD1-like motif [Chryseobacterium sp. SORGH_AS_1048]MDR6087528.1 putative DNA-binding protein with PD1-like motif [Chryseobacterium sp. SORGH_AS_0909]MDR6131903.1 putative DNA-binding protein with PD1-li
MDIHLLHTSFWTAQKIESTYILSIKDNISIIAAFKDFMIRQKIHSGCISGMGLVKEARLRLHDPFSKKAIDAATKDIMEVPEISGTINHNGESAEIHLNARLTSNDTSLSGRLIDAKVYDKMEFIIHPPKTVITIFDDGDPFCN